MNSDVRYGFLMRLLSIAVLLALVFTPLFAQKTKTPVTDDVIVDQVRVKIADDSEVGGQPITVDAHNGVVVLTGKVTNDKLSLLEPLSVFVEPTPEGGHTAGTH